MAKYPLWIVGFLFFSFFVKAKTNIGSNQNTLAQIPTATATTINPAQSIIAKSPEVPKEGIEARNIERLPPIINFYSPKNRLSKPIGIDGSPIRNESFNFSDDELKQVGDFLLMKKVLKREQRRLTTLFFKEHQIFQDYEEKALTRLIKNVADDNDLYLDAAKDFSQLNYYSFENFRGHLLRKSGVLLYTSHYRLKNTTSPKESFIQKAKPIEFFDYVAISSLVLNILLGLFLFFKD